LVPDDVDSGHTPVEAGSPEAANDYSLRFLFSVVFAMGAQTKEEFIAELCLDALKSALCKKRFLVISNL
jgi:hypothetical protein